MITEDNIIQALKTVYDPEIPVDVYELGLIYDIKVHDKVDNIQRVDILMTLTSPNCPVAESLPLEIQETALAVEGVDDVNVELTFEPPFTQDMMSEEAKFELGMM
jgi:FeS assembly SUF system protein|tara:strand:+ start:400 stop:714 length:315 start_codon:yes stop_codon:yes gene_type:complete